jgi:hypothetical protein
MDIFAPSQWTWSRNLRIHQSMNYCVLHTYEIGTHTHVLTSGLFVCTYCSIPNPVTPSRSYGDWLEQTEISPSHPLPTSTLLSRPSRSDFPPDRTWPVYFSQFILVLWANRQVSPKAQAELRNGELWVPDEPHAGSASGRLDRFEAFGPCAHGGIAR